MINIKCRKIASENDILELYKMMSSSEQYLFSIHLSFNTYVEFYDWLISHINSDFHDFYVVTNASEDEKLIGFAYNYDFTLESGHCKICVFVSELFRNLGLGSTAGIKFIDILFKKYPLQKIYSTIYSYNYDSLESNLKAGFSKEGNVKKYRYFNGNYYDLYYLSINREKFDTTLQKFVER